MSVGGKSGGGGERKGEGGGKLASQGQFWSIFLVGPLMFLEGCVLGSLTTNWSCCKQIDQVHPTSKCVQSSISSLNLIADYKYI